MFFAVTLSEDEITAVDNVSGFFTCSFPVSYTHLTDNSKQELLNLCLNDTDYVILSSGSAAKAFSEMTDTSNIKLISIGNETTKSAEKCGLKIYKTADNATAESIIDCIRRDTK